MTQSSGANRRIVLASRPNGAPTPDDFRLEQTAVPVPADGQLLLRTIYLSLDPYMRGRMSDAPSYAPPVEVGHVMVGGTVSRVIESHHAGFSEGDLVVGMNGWQDYDLSDGKGLMKLPVELDHPSYALGVLGMPGFTAYMGLLDIGRPKPGETVVVSAASGAVGSVVGQLAKSKECRVVGIAGGLEKCRHAVAELGYDACLDHREPDLRKRLAAACPHGIDVYFENVGGAVFDAVLPNLNSRARIPLCGLVSEYNDRMPREGPDRLSRVMHTLLRKRIELRGFIIFLDYGPRYGEFLKEMRPLVAEGRIRYKEDIVDGLEIAPHAFMGLLEGKNFGKLIVHVAEDAP